MIYKFSDFFKKHTVTIATYSKTIDKLIIIYNFFTFLKSDSII